MISVKDFKKGCGRYSTGTAIVLYWELTMICQIVIFKSREGVYIKLPQSFDPRTKKRININYFENKEFSNAFQREVMEQLKEKFPTSLEIPTLQQSKKNAKTFTRAKKSKEKEAVRNPVSTNPPVKDKFEKGKARNASRFACKR